MKLKRKLWLVPLFCMLLIPGRPAQVVLSFDVEVPDTPEQMFRLIELLDRHNVKATFFVVNQFAEQHPDVINAILENGHELAYHKKSHPWLPHLNITAKVEELRRPRSIMRGFRAPWLVVDSATLEMLPAAGYKYDSSLLDVAPQANPQLPELRISTYFGIPPSDVFFMYYLHLPQVYTAIVEGIKTERLVLLFHPHHIMNREDILASFITRFKGMGAVFVRCEDAV